MNHLKALTKTKANIRSFKRRHQLFNRIMNKCIVQKKDPNDWEEDACLIWNGGHNKRGHGRIKCDGVLWYPHRLIWILTRGPIPHNHVIHHTCGNSSCCNINHMTTMHFIDHIKMHRNNKTCSL
jgi:hypothetical protein